jgi:hypothetical protein
VNFLYRITLYFPVGSLDFKATIESGYLCGWARYRNVIFPTFSEIQDIRSLFFRPAWKPLVAA